MLVVLIPQLTEGEQICTSRKRPEKWIPSGHKINQNLEAGQIGATRMPSHDDNLMWFTHEPMSFGGGQQNPNPWRDQSKEKALNPNEPLVGISETNFLHLVLVGLAKRSTSKSRLPNIAFNWRKERGVSPQSFSSMYLDIWSTIAIRGSERGSQIAERKTSYLRHISWHCRASFWRSGVVEPFEIIFCTFLLSHKMRIDFPLLHFAILSISSTHERSSR